MKRFKKFAIIILALFLLSSCQRLEVFKSSFYDIKDKLVERVKVSLSNVPFIKKYITLYPAPKKLYTETKDLINQLKEYKAEKIFKKEYEKVLSAWIRAKDFYQWRYYKSAEKELKRVNSMANKLLAKVKAYKATLKNSALQKYEKMEKLAKKILKNNKSQKKKLAIELYLWKLRNLIDLEDYSEFEKEIQNPPF